MLFKIIINDMKKNPGNHFVLLLFMTFSVGLIATVILMISQLFTSISEMYEIAKPPHFLQMHKGNLKQEEIDKFNQAYPNITHWQTIEMINLNGDELTVENGASFTLSECRLDISMVKQNSQYDLLLDENREPVHLKPGEIAVPVILLEKYPIQIGDTIVLESNGIKKEFNITSFLYDGQMNSTLCSSTRFLLSDADFQAIRGIMGDTEYLIEVYFKEPSMAADYQGAYEQYEGNLPKNGQAVTYTIIFLLSAMTDIMTAMILLMISLLLILIALFCMKYIILTAIEEELTEIGTMKAIGMPHQAITRLYLGKIKFLMALGVVFGFLFSLVSFQYTSQHMNRTFGTQPLSWISLSLGALGSLLIYFIATHFCKGILKKLEKLHVIDALVRGNGVGKEKTIRSFIYKTNKFPAVFLMALHEVKTEIGSFALIIWVMALVTCITILPINIVTTMQAKEFITYMGSNVNDVLIEIEQGSDLENKYQKLEKLLLQEDNISFQSLHRIRILALDANEKKKSIHIDSGESAGVGLQYLKGKAPKTVQEIALSKLEAEYLGKDVGDSLLLSWENEEMALTVSGIYQDVTSGGMTAKARCPFTGVIPEQYTFMVDFYDEAQEEAVIKTWQNLLGNGYSIEQMEEFISDIIGGVVKQMIAVAWVATSIAMGLTGLVVLLFIKLRMARTASQIRIQNKLGISTKTLHKQELYQILITSAIGITCGTIVANGFGEYLVSILFSVMDLGIERIDFFINPMISWVVVPLTLLMVAGIFCWIAAKRIRNLNMFIQWKD